MSHEIPTGVRAFIAAHIVSIEQLEILLLLYESRERSWSCDEIVDKLRSQTNSVAHWLQVLVRLDLCTRDGDRYRISPAAIDPIAALASEYKVRWVRVIECIFARRDETLLNFARAFVIKPPPP